jgi:hypothetical protein
MPAGAEQRELSTKPILDAVESLHAVLDDEKCTQAR